MTEVIHTSEEQTKASAHAEAICVQAGVLQRCEKCLRVSQSSADPTDAYKLGNAKFSQNSDLAEPFETRRDMTDAIQQAHGDAGSCDCDAPYNTMK